MATAPHSAAITASRHPDTYNARARPTPTTGALPSGPVTAEPNDTRGVGQTTVAEQDGWGASAEGDAFPIFHMEAGGSRNSSSPGTSSDDGQEPLAVDEPFPAWATTDNGRAERAFLDSIGRAGARGAASLATPHAVCGRGVERGV